MAESTEFSPGKQLPVLGVTTRTTSPWERWGLPAITGLGIALVVLFVT